MRAFTISSLQIGLPQTAGVAGAAEPFDRPWTTGIFKQPVEGDRWVSRLGIEGDGQADLKNHGGVDKAICCYPAEHYPLWATALDLPLPQGAFGENFTTTGLTEGDVCVGDIFQWGSVRVQVTQPRQPCWKLARRWRNKDLAAQVERTGRTGWYLRVLQEGAVRAGVALELTERPSPEWTITAANEVMHHRKEEADVALALAACPGLSGSWKASLTRRAAGREADTSARLVGPGDPG